VSSSERLPTTRAGLPARAPIAICISVRCVCLPLNLLCTVCFELFLPVVTRCPTRSGSCLVPPAMATDCLDAAHLRRAGPMCLGSCMLHSTARRPPPVLRRQTAVQDTAAQRCAPGSL